MTTLDKENFDIINKLVKDHFSLSRKSQERFTNLLYNPVISEEYMNVIGDDLGDDLRVRKSVTFDILADADYGWKTLQVFKTFMEETAVTYHDFSMNRIVYKKNIYKFAKLFSLIYKENIDKFVNEITREQSFGYSYDSILSYLKRDLINDYINYKENATEKDENEIIKLVESGTTASFVQAIEHAALNISSRRIDIERKRGTSLELVMSFNFADWFLCSTGENWTSCLNLDNDYNECYWAGVPGLIADKNKCMIYFTYGDKKEKFGIKTDKFVMRGWGNLSQDGTIYIPKLYPSIESTLHFPGIQKVFGFKPFEDGFRSKYPVDFLTFSHGDSVYPYVDGANIIRKDNKFVFLQSSGGGHYVVDNSGYVSVKEIFNYEDGLSGLIQNNEELSTYVEDTLVCSACNSSIHEDDAFYIDGEYYCETCYYDNFVECDACNSSIHEDDAFYIDGEYYCETCYYDNFGECDACGRKCYLDNTVYIESEGVSICDSCIDRHYTQCMFCGEYIPNDDAIEYIDKRGRERSACCECIEENTVSCRACETIFEDASKINEDGLCKECAEELAKKNDAQEENLTKEAV